MSATEEVGQFSQDQLQSLLWHVCEKGPVAALQKLLDVHKLPLDLLNTNGQTPLMVAVQSGPNDIVRAILKRRPDLQRRWHGKTCIEIAKKRHPIYQTFQMEAIQLIAAKDFERLEEMVSAGLEPEDDSDLSPLEWAKSAHVPEAVRLLSSSPSDCSALSGEGNYSGHVGRRRGISDSLGFAEVVFESCPRDTFALHVTSAPSMF